jgi:outer membrane protein assembly factor BamB
LKYRAAGARCFCIVALLLVSCSKPAAPIDPAESWTMYQRTPDHNAIVKRNASYGSWRFNTNGQINGGLAVSGDVLYLDTLAGDLFAIDLKRRSVIWQRHVSKHSLMSAPLVYNGTVIVGSGNTAQPPGWATRKITMGAPEGDAIYAFDAKNGAPKWSYHTAGEDMPTAVVAGGALIFANGDFHAYALDPGSGRLLWKSTLSGLATMASATVARGRAIVSDCDYRFPYHCETDALDVRTGAIVWRAPYGNADSSPAYANGLIFLSGLEYPKSRKTWRLFQYAYAVVAALDAATGKPKWVYRDGEPSLPTDVGTAERAVAGTYADGKYFQSLPGTSTLMAFDAESGKVLWRRRTLAPVKMSPLYYRGRVYAGGNEGLLYILSASTGEMLRVQPFRLPFTSSPPVLVGSTLLLPQSQSVQSVPLRLLFDKEQE